MSMPVIAQLRLSLGTVQLAMNMLREADRGRKSPVSPQAAEILYTAYFSHIRMGDVAAMLGVSRSTATDHINYLEREGYVRREKDPDDRRAYRIVPTQKGEEWILTIEERLFAYLEEGMSRLTEDEQHAFARLCATFTGVSDSESFMGTLQELKESRDRLYIPMKFVTEGRLMRLEDVTHRRYQKTSEKRDEQVNRMIPPRIPETDHGIQDEDIVLYFDQMQKNLRDAGRLPTESLIESGIRDGTALEVGPGPGLVGLEWLQATGDTRLVGLEISPAMIALAEQNARDYGLCARVHYMEGNAVEMPFAENTFDAVFSNGSLHEWAAPEAVFTGIARVLKPGGRCCITDLRRDLAPETYQAMHASCDPPEMRPGLETSVQAAYTPDEITAVLRRAGLGNWDVFAHPYGLAITGQKP